MSFQNGKYEMHYVLVLIERKHMKNILYATT